MTQENQILRELARLAADEAIANEFQIPEKFSRLCKVINYLVAEIQISATLEGDEAKNHVENVLKSTIAILGK